MHTRTHIRSNHTTLQTLLRIDFGLDWWIPDGHLIPPLPNRANYIHWIEDLLELSSPTSDTVTTNTTTPMDPCNHPYHQHAHITRTHTPAHTPSVPPTPHSNNNNSNSNNSDIVGLDIGCGTNLIYPLLGCAMHPKWRFVAVDITPAALQWARRNADVNDGVLQGRVVVRESGQAPALGAAPGVLCGWVVCCVCGEGCEVYVTFYFLSL